MANPLQTNTDDIISYLAEFEENNRARSSCRFTRAGSLAGLYAPRLPCRAISADSSIARLHLIQLRLRPRAIPKAFDGRPHPCGKVYIYDLLLNARVSGCASDYNTIIYQSLFGTDVVSAPPRPSSKVQRQKIRAARADGIIRRCMLPVFLCRATL